MSWFNLYTLKVIYLKPFDDSTNYVVLCGIILLPISGVDNLFNYVGLNIFFQFFIEGRVNSFITISIFISYEFITYLFFSLKNINF